MELKKFLPVVIVGVAISTAFFVVAVLLNVAPIAMAKQQAPSVSLSPDRSAGQIKQMQDGLQKLGYYNGKQTGSIDKKTKQAIQQFQKDNGIKPPNGKISPKTLTIMFRLLSKLQNNQQGGSGDLGYRYAINPPKITPYTPPSESDPGAVEMRRIQSQSGYWMETEKGWQAIGTPPACPNPLVLKPPVDFSLVTSILYPGQYRGGQYKAHGGFRFDNAPNNSISVKIPLDATLVNGAKYIENGEVQYLFTFHAPCGIRYRFDHLFTLTPRFQKIAEGFPLGAEGDSHTTEVNPPASVTTGEEIAVAVGFTQTKNVAVDFGVYDMRTQNAAASNASFIKEHENDPGLKSATHALCWFDLFPSFKQMLLNLPGGDSASGKKSDYCL